VLDSSRLRAFIAEELGVSPLVVEAMTLGSHGESMVPLPRHATVDGKPLTELVDDATLERLYARTRDAGAEIVGLLKKGSAYYAPSASAGRMVEAIAGRNDEPLPVSAWCTGQYDIDAVYVGVPVRLSSTGVSEIVELDLNDDELARAPGGGRRHPREVRGPGDGLAHVAVGGSLETHPSQAEHASRNQQDAAAGGDPQSRRDLDAQVLVEQLGEPLAHHLLGESELKRERPRHPVGALDAPETVPRADRARDGQRDAERPEDEEGDREPAPCACGARDPHREHHEERGHGREQHDLALPHVDPVDRDVRRVFDVGREPIAPTRASRPRRRRSHRVRRTPFRRAGGRWGEPST
jgi:hypothetical protein